MKIYNYIYYSIYTFIYLFNKNATHVSTVCFISLIESFLLLEIYLVLLSNKLLSFYIFKGYINVVLIVGLMGLNFLYFLEKERRSEFINLYEKERGYLSFVKPFIVYGGVILILYFFFTYAIDELGRLRFQRLGILPNETL